MSIPIFIFQVCMAVKNHQATFILFKISHELRYAKMRWNSQSPPPVKRVARLTAISLCC